MGLPNLQEIIMRLVVILPALTWHEFAHAYVADKMGDPTPRMNGRLTLNPIAHIDPIGTILLPIFVRFGWAKPVPINPYNFSDPRKGSLLTSAAGPVSNLMQGLVVGLIVRGVLLVAPALALRSSTAIVLDILISLTAVNVMLAIFNLIPLGPLDGHHIVEALLPYQQLVEYRRFNQYGFVILLGVIFLLPKVFSMVVVVPALLFTRLVTGI